MDTYPMVVPDPRRPKTYHSPQWNQGAENVRKQEHALGSYLEMLLDIPEAER